MSVRFYWLLVVFSTSLFSYIFCHLLKRIVDVIYTQLRICLLLLSGLSVFASYIFADLFQGFLLYSLIYLLVLIISHHFNYLVLDYVLVSDYASTPWRRKWQPTPVFLPGKSHGWRNLAGYSPWGRKELDTTE